MKLRPYQQECLEAIITEARSGCTKQLMVLPTGSGKTVVFAQLPQKVKEKGKKTLILAHREELLEQAKDKLEIIAPDLNVGIEQGKKVIEDYDNIDVVIASVPTLGRKGSKRIEKLDPDDFALIICDEAHHAASDSYLRIFEYFDVLKGKVRVPNGRVLLGCTATPNRADKVGLDKVFDKIVFNYDILSAINDGYLSDIRAFKVDSNTDISGVATRRGDFAEGELGEEVNNEERNTLVVESYRDIAGDSKAIVFAVNVEHAYSLTEKFKEYGYIAACVVGETDNKVRKEVLEFYKKGKIQVLVGVGVFLEGYDEPSIETVIMARPTKSSVLYSQAVGRGTRIYPNKAHLTLIDITDNIGEHSVINIPSIFGIQANIKTRGHKITELVEKVEKILKVNPSVDLEKIDDWSDNHIDKIIRKVDIFAQARLPEVVKSNSKYAWNRYMDGYRIDLPYDAELETKDSLVVQPNMLGRYDVIWESFEKCEPSAVNKYHKWKKVKNEPVGVSNEIFDAFKEGDKWIGQNRSNYKAMLSHTAEWREEDPSEAQLGLLKKLGVPIPEGISKGLCSNLIASALNERKGR